MEHLRKQGFTLIEVLIGIAIMAIAMAAFASMINNYMILSNTVQFRLEAEDVRRDIQSLLKNSSVCRANLQNQNAGTAIILNQLVDTGGIARFQNNTANPNAVYSNLVTIQSFNVQPIVFDDPANLAVLTGTSSLEITFDPLHQIVGSSTSTRKITLYVTVGSRAVADPNYMRVTDCSSDSLGSTNSMAVNCQPKISVTDQQDKVLWCPSNYPYINSCTAVDNQAPAAGFMDLSSCGGDGYCDVSSGSPHGFSYERTNLGEDDLSLEYVYKPDVSVARIEGCLAYDESHSHASYRLQIICCK